MGYQNAPATRMMASQCAFCSKPLVDAQSVEVGVGPVCRKKHMVADAVDEAARKEGNQLIYHIALIQKGPSVEGSLDRLAELGLMNAAFRIKQRLVKGNPVELWVAEDRLLLKTPFVDRGIFNQLIAAIRRVPGRSWNGQFNHFPVSEASKRALNQVLCKFFPGRHAIGPKGKTCRVSSTSS